MEKKRCSRCKEWKNLDCFGKNKSKKDGLQYQCKECKKKDDKEYYEEHKDEKKEYDKKYYNSLVKFNSTAKYRQDIELYEEIRESAEGYLQCKCYYCKMWFTPTIRNIINRLKSMNYENLGEGRLYCSEDCKKYCPEYGQILYFKNQIKIKPKKEKKEKKPFKHTEETKKLLSEKRKLYLKNNPDKHPWKNNDKFISMPCERIKEFLKDNNINFVEEYSPLKDRFFSIDIAFPDIKMGIEVNGNQHYKKNGELKSYYRDRHNLIEHDGWKLLEIHYSIYNNDEELQKLLDFIGKREQPDYSYYIKEQKEKEEQKKKNMPLKRGEKQKIKTDIKWEPYKELVLNSGIDFEKFGWVKKVSEILGLSHQKVNEWMKRYLLEFYEENCFKRKSPNN